MTQNVQTVMTIAMMVATTACATVCAPTRQRTQPTSAVSADNRVPLLRSDAQVGVPYRQVDDGRLCQELIHRMDGRLLHVRQDVRVNA
jgi:hypothetical protein